MLTTKLPCSIPALTFSQFPTNWFYWFITMIYFEHFLQTMKLRKGNCVIGKERGRGYLLQEVEYFILVVTTLKD